MPYGTILFGSQDTIIPDTLISRTSYYIGLQPGIHLKDHSVNRLSNLKGPITCPGLLFSMTIPGCFLLLFASLLDLLQFVFKHGPHPSKDRLLPGLSLTPGIKHQDIIPTSSDQYIFLSACYVDMRCLILGAYVRRLLSAYLLYAFATS